MNQFAKENLMDKKEILDRISEFKTHIIYSSILFLLTSTLGLVLSKQIIKILEQKIPFSVNFIQFTPDEIFITSLKIAFLIGLYISIPVILFQLIKFDLKDSQQFSKKFLRNELILGFSLFTAGILFGYFAILPFSLFFLLGFNSDLARAAISISSYIDFCLQSIIFTGLIFNIPVFITFLRKTNYLQKINIMSRWKPLCIGILIISSGIIFSTEIIKIVIIALTVIFLLCFSLFLAKISKRSA